MAHRQQHPRPARPGRGTEKASTSLAMKEKISMAKIATITKAQLLWATRNIPDDANVYLVTHVQAIGRALAEVAPETQPGSNDDVFWGFEDATGKDGLGNHYLVATHSILGGVSYEEEQAARKELDQRRVDSWNRSVAIGAKVTYLKSNLEGKIILKTTGKAFIFGGEPVVELEHIGMATLSKVEIYN